MIRYQPISLKLKQITYGTVPFSTFICTSVGTLMDVNCGADGCETNGLERRDCFPILISSLDPFFNNTKKCHTFVRSEGVPNTACSPGYSLIFFVVEWNIL